MMSRRNLHAASFVSWLMTALFLLLWIGGIVSYGILGGVPAGSEAAAPAFLAVAWLLLIVAERGRRFGRLLIVGLLGFGVEVSGVWFAVPFGGYHYTDHLGPALARVPLVMIAAWPVLVAYAESIGRTRGWSGWRLGLFGAAWLVGIDLLLDPLAAGPLGYWVWHGKAHWFGIPASNFLGWAIVGAVLTVGLGLKSAADDPLIDLRPARLIGRVVLGFFVVIAFVLMVWVPGIVGLLLLIIELKWLPPKSMTTRDDHEQRLPSEPPGSGKSPVEPSPVETAPVEKVASKLIPEEAASQIVETPPGSEA